MRNRPRRKRVLATEPGGKNRARLHRTRRPRKAPSFVVSNAPARLGSSINILFSYYYFVCVCPIILRPRSFGMLSLSTHASVLALEVAALASVAARSSMAVSCAFILLFFMPFYYVLGAPELCPAMFLEPTLSSPALKSFTSPALPLPSIEENSSFRSFFLRLSSFLSS